MKIRECSANEWRSDPWIVVFMKQFEQASSFVKVDVQHAWKKYQVMMDSGIARVFIAEGEDEKLQGAIGFLISEDLHDGKKTAVETFWFVAPEFRGIGMELFKVFEAEAIKAGCQKLAMIHMTDSYPESLQAFYTRQGYRLIEQHFVREV